MTYYTDEELSMMTLNPLPHGAIVPSQWLHGNFTVANSRRESLLDASKQQEQAWARIISDYEADMRQREDDRRRAKQATHAAHWYDEFIPPLPNVPAVETPAEREDTIAAIWQGMADAMTCGTGWVCIGADFAKREDINSIWKTPAATQAAAYAGARDSDCAAIGAMLAEPKQPQPEPPKAPSRVKPAIAGLGVTTPEDHRLGRWKA